MTHCLWDFVLLLSSAFLKNTVCWEHPLAEDCPTPTTLWPFTLNLFLHPLQGPWLGLCPLSQTWMVQPVLQPHGPSLSTHHPCAQLLLGSREVRPHRSRLGHPGGFTLNCAKPAVLEVHPSSHVLREGRAVCKPTSTLEHNSCGLSAIPTPELLGVR